MIPIELLKKDYGTEMALVVLACRVYCNTADKKELQNYIADKNPDWNLVCTICRNHSIRPVVYKTLLSIELPLETEKLIKEEYLSCTVKNWKMALETERIIGLLAENGVQAWPYKGTAFSRQFYGDLISRETSDIDLAIYPKDLDAVIMLMHKDGYRSEDTISFKYLGEKFFQTNKDYNFNKIAGKEPAFHIEFHWSITENYLGYLKSADLLLYKKEAEVLLVKLKVIGLTALAHALSVLIHHSIKDCFKSLKNLIDIYQLNILNQNADEYMLFTKHITDLHLNKIRAISNLLNDEILGIQSSEINIPVSKKTRDYFINQVLSEHVINTHTIVNKHIIINRFLFCDTLLDKIKFLATFFQYRFTPTIADFRIVRLPHSIYFIYYLCKPFRSLIKPYDFIKEKRKISGIKK